MSLLVVRDRWTLTPLSANTDADIKKIKIVDTDIEIFVTEDMDADTDSKYFSNVDTDMDADTTIYYFKQYVFHVTTQISDSVLGRSQ